MEATEDEDRGIGGVEFGLNLLRCVLLTYKFLVVAVLARLFLVS